MLKSATMSSEVMPEIELDDAMCKICLEIYVEPITMPCQHRLCKVCFERNYDQTSIHCPFCKKRLGIWKRKAKDVNELIDKDFWKKLQIQYAEKIEARQKGITSDCENVQNNEIHHRICKAGEIRHDFDKLIEEAEIEDQQISEKEKRKSQAMIIKIQREELAKMANPNDVSELSNTPNNTIEDESPAFHGWKKFDGVKDECSGDSSIREEFIQIQKSMEDKANQTKEDEIYAKNIQILAESPKPSTSAQSYNIQSTPLNQGVPKTLFASNFDSDSASDIEDTQDMYNQILMTTKGINCDDNVIADILSLNQKIDTQDLIDEDYINKQIELENKIRQEREDEKFAQELQRKLDEEEKRAQKNKIATKNQSLNESKINRQSPGSLKKRQLSIEESVKYGFESSKRDKMFM